MAGAAEKFCAGDRFRVAEPPIKGAQPQQSAAPVRIRIGRDEGNGTVAVEFSPPVRFLTLPRNQAIDVANALLKNARKLKGLK